MPCSSWVISRINESPAPHFSRRVQPRKIRGRFGKLPEPCPSACPPSRSSLLPKDTNALGTIFGGVILSHIDLASAGRGAQDRAAPLRHQGDARGGVPRAGLRRRRRRTSSPRRCGSAGPRSPSRCEVEAERWGGGQGEQVKVTEAEVILVAVGPDGRPTLVGPTGEDGAAR